MNDTNKPIDVRIVSREELRVRLAALERKRRERQILQALDIGGYKYDSRTRQMRRKRW